MSLTSITRRKKWDGVIDSNKGYKYALVYMISEILLIPLDLWKTVDLGECLEARIFGLEGELHLFREDDELMAVIVRDLPEKNIENQKAENAPSTIESIHAEIDNIEKMDTDIRRFAYIDRAREIRSNCMMKEQKYNRLIIREYIAYDGDGQAYTALTRLVGLQ